MAKGRHLWELGWQTVTPDDPDATAEPPVTSTGELWPCPECGGTMVSAGHWLDHILARHGLLVDFSTGPDREQERERP